MKSIKESKEFQKFVKDHGFKLIRTCGSHSIYNNETVTISIPYKLNAMIERRLRKIINN